MSDTIVILNGPNLNLLGTREPDIYGATTLADIEASCHAHAEKVGVKIDFRQSNIEGELVDWIQQAQSTAMAVIINAAAYTHTSVALHDALKATGLPVVELHLSNVYKRESFRHKSFISSVADGVMCGFGAHGYVMAIDAAKHIATTRTDKT
ncbi:MAG: type II 3-dehydroquinate dehydratase [Anderseniella sp.]